MIIGGVICFFYIFCLLIYPLSSLFGAAFDSKQIFDPLVLSVAAFTIKQSLMSTLLSLLGGVPLGCWIGTELSQKKLISNFAQVFVALPFAVPTVVAAGAWLSWLGNAGVLAQLGLRSDWAYSLNAVIIAHVFLNIPWVAWIVSQTRSEYPRNLLEVARGLGASFFYRMVFLLLPFLRNSILSAGCQVFSFCAMSFSLVLFLGGGPPVETLETAIYSKVRYGGFDLGSALGFAFWQFFITSIPWMLAQYLVGKSFLKKTSGASRVSFQKTSFFKTTGLLFISGFFLVPYLIVVVKSAFYLFLNSDSLSFWKDLVSSLQISIYLAFFAALLTIIFSLNAIMFCYKKKLPRLFVMLLHFFMTLPGGLSTLVLGISILLAYQNIIDLFSGSLFYMILLQSVLFVPIAYRVFWITAQESQYTLLEAARSLGAKAMEAFYWIELPRWKTPILIVFGGVTSASLGEVAAVSLFYHESFQPLTVLMSRLMSQYRFDEAETVGTFLLIFSLGVLGIFSWIGTKERVTR